MLGRLARQLSSRSPGELVRRALRALVHGPRRRAQRGPAAEVNLARLDWLGGAGRAGRAGCVLVLDYGLEPRPCTELGGPARCARFAGHHVSGDVLRGLGIATSPRRRLRRSATGARTAGLDGPGPAARAEFLIGGRPRRRATRGRADARGRRLQARFAARGGGRLARPEALGGYQVIVLAATSTPPPLRGLDFDLRRPRLKVDPCATGSPRAIGHRAEPPAGGPGQAMRPWRFGPPSGQVAKHPALAGQRRRAAVLILIYPEPASAEAHRAH